MGKAQRIKKINIEDRQVLAAQRRQGFSKDKKQSKVLSIIKVVSVILVVVIIAGAVVFKNMMTSGFFYRHMYAASSENYTISGSMMTYFFNSSYQNFLQQNSSYMQYLGLDTSKSLKEQDYQENYSWYDYFMDSTKSNVESMLILAEAAIENGFKLEKEDYDAIDKNIASLKNIAVQNNVSAEYYIKNVFGSSVNLKDIRKCMEIATLSEKYRNSLIESYEFTSDDYNKYFDENSKRFLYVDYLSYTFEAEKDKKDSTDTTTTDTTTADTADGKDAAKTEEMLALKGYAEDLAKTKTPEEFYDYIRTYLTDVVYKDYTEEQFEKENIDIDEKVKAVLTEGKQYSSSDMLDWAYGDNVKTGDVYTEYDTENGAYSVYMMVKAPYRHEYNTRNIMHMMFTKDDYGDLETAKSIADDTLKKWVDGGKTEEKFVELAKEYSDDSSNVKYENLDKNDFKVTELDNWVYADDRKLGDYEVVKSEQYGYHILYYVSDGEIAWEHDVDEILTENKFDSYYTELEEKHKITFSKENLKKIVPITLKGNTETK